MDCSICYENFIQPTSDENYEELKKEFEALSVSDEPTKHAFDDETGHPSL